MGPVPVVGELQRHLDEGVGTEAVMLREILPKPPEVEHVHIQVVDQAGGGRGGGAGGGEQEEEQEEGGRRTGGGAGGAGGVEGCAGGEETGE